MRTSVSLQHQHTRFRNFSNLIHSLCARSKIRPSIFLDSSTRTQDVWLEGWWASFSGPEYQHGSREHTVGTLSVSPCPSFFSYPPTAFQSLALLLLTLSPSQTYSGSSTPSTQPQAPAGGLFGSAPATQAPTQTTNLFGTNTASTSQPAQTTSLFGTQPAQPAQQSQTGGGGLFGSNNNTMATSKPGGLFGTSTTATSQPTQTTSLFGTQPAQQSQTGGGGLFGQSQQKPAGSLFGPSATTNTQAAGATGGLFGQKPAAPATTSLWGQAPGRSLL